MGPQIPSSHPIKTQMNLYWGLGAALWIIAALLALVFGGPLISAIQLNGLTPAGIGGIVFELALIGYALVGLIITNATYTNRKLTDPAKLTSLLQFFLVLCVGSVILEFVVRLIIGDLSFSIMTIIDLALIGAIVWGKQKLRR